MLRPYDSINSWGPTYGQHKAYLEFSIQQYKLLQAYAKDINILFTASAMDIVSLQELYTLDLPFIKIGSGDANNFPLLKYAASISEIPLIISTGMQTEKTIRKIVCIMKNYNKTNYCLMHCVSSYPTLAENTNLRLMKLLSTWFPDICIGYSGHEEGIAISVAAVLLGAKVQIKLYVIYYFFFN